MRLQRKIRIPHAPHPLDFFASLTIPFRMPECPPRRHPRLSNACRETYTLQTIETSLLRRATCDFVVRGGPDPQDIAVPLERNVGDILVMLRSMDGRALPVGVPFQIRHRKLGCVVAEGRSTLSDVQVIIDHWYVDQGALYGKLQSRGCLCHHARRPHNLRAHQGHGSRSSRLSCIHPRSRRVLP